jgi:hypothetical protein
MKNKSAKKKKLKFKKKKIKKIFLIPQFFPLLLIPCKQPNPIFFFFVKIKHQLDV